MHWSSFSQMVSQKHCSEPKNGFGGENGGWCIGDALIVSKSGHKPLNNLSCSSHGKWTITLVVQVQFGLFKSHSSLKSHSRPQNSSELNSKTSPLIVSKSGHKLLNNLSCSSHGKWTITLVVQVQFGLFKSLHQVYRCSYNFHGEY